jgi:dihydrofolate synthase/folylpolyglutamate synthase
MSWTWTGGNAFVNCEITGLRSNRASLVQQENDSLSIAVLKLLQKDGFNVSEQQIRQGLASVKWPGRMEYFDQEYVCTEEDNEVGSSKKVLRYLLDGAHNTDGVKNLAKTLREKFQFKKLVGVWGAMVDKDLAATLDLMAPIVDELIITQPEGERAATPEQIHAILNAEQQQKARCIKEVDEALAVAQETAEEGDLIVVGGSLYLIGAVRHLLLGDLI